MQCLNVFAIVNQVIAANFKLCQA